MDGAMPSGAHCLEGGGLADIMGLIPEPDRRGGLKPAHRDLNPFVYLPFQSERR